MNPQGLLMPHKTFSWSRTDLSKVTEIISDGAGSRTQGTLMSVMLTHLYDPLSNPDDYHFSVHLVTHPISFLLPPPYFTTSSSCARLD